MDTEVAKATVVDSEVATEVTPMAAKAMAVVTAVV